MTIEQWLLKASAYFDGTMAIEEARAFEQQTAENDELSELMKLWKLTDAEASAYEQYKPEVEAFINTHQRLKKEFIGVTPARAVKFPAWKWVAAAAVLAGIFLIGKLLWPTSSEKPPVVVQNTKPVSPDSTVTPNPVKEKESPSPSEKNQHQNEVLYAQSFTPDDIPGDPNGPLDDAYFYYASKQYKKAITAIDSAGSRQLTRGGGDLNATTKLYGNYYKALSLMSLGNEDAAIPLLNQTIPQNAPQSLKVKSRWYLALAYIKHNERSLASTLLESLANDSSSGAYKNKARKLLSDLKEQ